MRISWLLRLFQNRRSEMRATEKLTIKGRIARRGSRWDEKSADARGVRDVPTNEKPCSSESARDAAASKSRLCVSVLCVFVWVSARGRCCARTRRTRGTRAGPRKRKKISGAAISVDDNDAEVDACQLVMLLGRTLEQKPVGRNLRQMLDTLPRGLKADWREEKL